MSRQALFGSPMKLTELKLSLVSGSFLDHVLLLNYFCLREIVLWRFISRKSLLFLDHYLIFSLTWKASGSLAERTTNRKTKESRYCR